MSEELKQNQENEKNAGCIGFSVLFPIVGIIMHKVHDYSDDWE